MGHLTEARQLHHFTGQSAEGRAHADIYQWNALMRFGFRIDRLSAGVGMAF